MLTKDGLLELLATNDKAIARALIVLHNRQTSDEQAQEVTNHHNGRGFRPCHSRMGSSMAKFYLRYNYLSSKQVAYWRIRNSKGQMKIAIYHAQILEEAAKKSAQQNQVISFNYGHNTSV